MMKYAASSSSVAMKILLLFLVGTNNTFLLSAEAAKKDSSSSLSCPGPCEPNGECINGECVCDDGFAGADCSFPFVHCPDDRTMCFDGAQCQRIATKGDGDHDQKSRQDGYMCDCQHIPDASQFQIDECENPDSEVCELGQPTSNYAFCTNGGKCREMIHNGQPHAGCICTDDFEGRHCQYRKGTAPESELQAAYVDDKSHIAGGFIFLIVLIVFTLAWAVGSKFYNDRQNQFAKAEDLTRIETTLGDLQVTDSIDESDTDDVVNNNGSSGGDGGPGFDDDLELKKTYSDDSNNSNFVGEGGNLC